MTGTPEQNARRDIDANLEAAGWLVQSRSELDLPAGRGVAVREFPMKRGFGTADYVLYVDHKIAGAIEAKAEGTLTGVEAQSAKYAQGVSEDLPVYHIPLPFLFESNGSVTCLPTDSTRHLAAVRSSTFRGRRRWRSGWRSRLRCAPG